MLSGVQNVIIKHVKKNLNTYFFLFLAFVVGISAGAFTVNGLSAVQRSELSNYFTGFVQLLDKQQVDSSELLKMSLLENMKLVCVLWVLGVSIIGIPFIYIAIGIRGFMTGFSSGFIIKALGVKGVMFSAVTLLPKDLVIVPCIIALGVSGINFSLSIIRKRSIKHISKESLKSNFAAYSFVTLVYSSIVFLGVMLEAYIIPVFVRMITPMLTV